MHISIISLLLPATATATATPIISDAGPGCTMPGLPLLDDYNAALNNMCNQWFPFSIDKCTGGSCLVYDNQTSLEVNQTVPTYDKFPTLV